MKLQDDLYKSVVTRVMESGRLPATKQSMKEGRYISKKDMIDVMKIDFDSDDIDTKIQACCFPPYNGAYIEHNGKKYTLVNDYILSTLTKNNQTFKKEE